MTDQEAIRECEQLRHDSTQAARIAELEAALCAALNMVDGDGAPPNWDWMRAVLVGKTTEYYAKTR